MSSERAASKGSTGSLVDSYRVHDIWSILLSIRIVNALTLQTFFQPDEFYQALEPAWALAFGKGKHAWYDGAFDGPWITWEWKHELRSAIYPTILAGVYKVIGFISDALFPPVSRTKLLIWLPKMVQALSAASMDYYTWAFAERVYGKGSLESTATFALAVFSPWQWFVSTRSLSNCLETTLTVMALYYWPWDWFKAGIDTESREKDRKNLKFAIILASIATVLRPTNILIWICLSLATLPRANKAEIFTFINNAVLFGSAVLVASVGVDRWYYGKVTFPPLNFLSFNVAEGLAVFYGENRPDYYFTEGIPLLLTTALPFVVMGFTQAFAGVYLALPPDTRGGEVHPSLLRTIAFTALFLPLSLSFIAHKEVRFIYPILPMLLVIISRPVIGFFHPFPNPTSVLRKGLLVLTIGVNVALAIYLGYFHNSGVMKAEAFLRSEVERLNPEMVRSGIKENMNSTTVGFLMPCHSVPWRSHLVYPELGSWQLTCEPPIGMSDEEKGKYVDEADKFYDDTVLWLRKEMALRRRAWPEYLVFYEALEPDLKQMVSSSAYDVAWRGFNALWHDDWRRKGDVIVWALSTQHGGPGARPGVNLGKAGEMGDGSEEFEEKVKKIKYPKVDDDEGEDKDEL